MAVSTATAWRIAMAFISVVGLSDGKSIEVVLANVNLYPR